MSNSDHTGWMLTAMGGAVVSLWRLLWAYSRKEITELKEQHDEDRSVIHELRAERESDREEIDKLRRAAEELRGDREQLRMLVVDLNSRLGAIEDRK